MRTQPDCGSHVVSRVIVDNNPKRRLSENSPPQPRRGGCAEQEKAAKPPKPAQTGWCWSTTKHFLDQHHPVRSIRRLRDIFIDVASSPPRLRRGVFARSVSVALSTITRDMTM